MGETPAGVPTYVPRLLLFDLRGSLGGARAAGDLYDDPGGAVTSTELPPVLTWNGSARVIRSDPEPKSSFLTALEAEAREEAEEEEEEVEEEDEEDRDSPREPSEDSDADAPSPSDPVAALRARMETHLATSSSTGRSATRSSSDVGPPRRMRARRTGSASRASARRARARARGEALERASLALESESRFWTDACKARLHPRSCMTLDGLWAGTDAFGGFGEGSAWLAESDRRESFLREPIRAWAEECDRLAGFQILAEDLGGFGSLAHAALEELGDEYGNAARCAFSLRPPTDATDDASRRRERLNAALAAARVAAATDAYVPVCGTAALSGFTTREHAANTDADANPSSAFTMRTSRAAALHAAAVDAATSPWRVSRASRFAEGATDPRAFARHLSARSNAPFAALAMGLPAAPFEAPEGGRPEDRPTTTKSAEASKAADDDDAAREAAEAARRAKARLGGLVNLTPDLGGDDARRAPLAEAYAIRGAEAYTAAAAGDSSTVVKRLSARDARAALDSALRLEPRLAPRLRFASSAPFPVPLTFPRGVTARWRAEHRIAAPCATRVASDAGFGDALRRVAGAWRSASRGAFGKATLGAWGVEGGDAGEVGEEIEVLAGAYDRGDGASEDAFGESSDEEA